MDLSFTTELKAVNMMLESIGEQHVASLPSTFYLATLAQTILARTSRAVQSRGWHWNTVENKLLVHNPETGKVELPPNVISVDALFKRDDVIPRGGYLYDRIEDTDELYRDIEVNITYMLPFEQLPDVLRQYIAIKAAREFQKKTVGDSALYRYTEEDELAAKILVESEEMRQADITILEYQPAWSVVNRRV